MADKIELGSTVMLKSGGTLMVVTELLVEPGKDPVATCKWNINGKHGEQQYPLSALDLVDTSNPAAGFF